MDIAVVDLWQAADVDNFGGWLHLRDGRLGGEDVHFLSIFHEVSIRVCLSLEFGGLRVAYGHTLIAW